MGEDDYSTEVADLSMRRAMASLAINKPLPDAAAKANSVARATGYPVATVDDNLTQLSQQVAAARARAVILKNPALMSWIANPRNAAVGADDVDELGKNERNWKSVVLPSSVVGSLKEEAPPEASIGSFFSGIYNTAIQSGIQARAGIRQIAKDWLPDLTPRSAPGVPRLGDFGTENNARDYARADAEINRATPDFKSKFWRYVYGGTSSLAQMVPSIAVGILASPAAGLAVAGGQQGLPAYEKYRTRGGTRGEALAGGLGEGAIEVATEKLPMGFIVNKLGKIGAGHFIAGFLGRELPTEIVATLGQNAVDTAIANPDKTWGQYLAEQPDQVAATAVGALMAGGFFTGANAVSKRFAQRDVVNGAAIEDADALSKAMDSAASSKTRARDPQAFRDFIDRFTNGSRVENVFVPAETLATYFQSNDMDYREDDFWRDYAPQIDEGLTTGGDVVIPTADAAAHLSGTPTWEAIKADVRTSPGGPSLSEVESQRADYEQSMQQMGAQVSEELAKAKEADAPRGAIYQDIRGKLTNAGYTQDAAHINAELVAQRYATRAERTGQALKGDETQHIAVNAVLPANLAPIVSKDAGDIALKGIINLMRSKHGAMTERQAMGPSLLEWIGKQGGIEDRGGDLKAMGALEWHKGKPGKRKLIRPHVDENQDTMLAPTGRENANSPDELALRAQEAGYFPKGERPTVNDLFGLVENELHGRHAYAQYNGDAESADNSRAAADELAQILDQRGLDPAKATDGEIKDALNQYQQEQMDGLKQAAYHGSPHRFDRFSTDAMGTGEGAQAFGWGLYFAGAKEIAEHYRDSLAGPASYQPKERSTAADKVAEFLSDNRSFSHAVANARNYFEDDIKLADEFSQYPGGPEEGWDGFKAKAEEGLAGLASLTEADFTRKKAGRLYHVDIPDDNEYLLWDRPLSEQPANIKAALEGLGFAEDAKPKPPSDPVIASIVRDALRHARKDKTDIALTIDNDSMLYNKAVLHAERAGVDTDDFDAGEYVVEQAKEYVDALEKSEITTGEQIYRDLSAKLAAPAIDESGIKGWTTVQNTINDRLANDKAASLAMHAVGIAGIKYLDGSSRADGDGSHNYVVFDDSRVSIRTYEQDTFADGPRGQISFVQGRSIIDLFQSRNTSTFLHEMGHQWLEELRQDAESDGSSDQAKADWQAVQDWFKANGHAVKDGTIPVDAHELWARGTERFLMEGKTPSSALRRVFDTFRSWMLHIYQVVDNLRSPITPEIRDVMNRLFATDEEIANANDQQQLNDLFSAAAEAGMSEQEFAAYKKLGLEARDEAHDQLLYKTMSSIRASRTKAWRDEEANVRADITERVNKRPEFRALELLRTGKTLGEPDVPAIKVKINRQWLIDNYGEGVLSQLPGGVPPLYTENGAHPDEIAELAGFANGDEMVRTLVTLQERKKELLGQEDKRSVKQALIDEETKAEMADRHGDPLNDGSIEEEALALVQNDLQGEKMATELRVLARKSNRTPTPYSMAKDWARTKIAESTVQEATSGSAIQRYSRTAAKAGKAAEQAMLKGDVDETFKQKQAQMLNNALVAEASRMRDAVEKARDRMVGYARRRTIKSMDQDYLDQIHALLEDVEFRPRTQASLERQQSFSEWAAAREAEGHDVVVPDSFAASLGQTHWSRLTVEKMLGLDDAIKQIAHLGRFKQELIDGAEKRAHEEVVGEAVGNLGNLPPRPPVKFDPNWSERMKARVDSFDAGLLKMETIVDWLDGGDSNGVFNRMAFRPIANAQAREGDMTADYFARIREAMSAVPNVSRWQERVTIPDLIDGETGEALQVTRQRLVAMALNMGNEGNIQRLTDGHGWNRDGVMTVLNRELTQDDWTFVQSVWDTFETLWPEIAGMERRVNGVEPDKVSALPLETSAGTLRGGYYPAVYDTTRDLRAEQSAGKAGDLLEANYTRATTRASATKDRLNKVKRPILLDLGVINRHLGEVIHDITHREAIINAHKFLSDTRIQKAVNDALGPEIRKQFQPWLKHVANQWASERSGNEGLGKFMGKLRANTTAVGMGFRASTILTQVAGLSNSQETIGGTWLANATAQSAAHPVESFRFVVERSGEVRHRMDNLDRDIGAMLRNMDLNPTKKVLGLPREAARFMYHGIGYADRLVVVPTWIAAYNKEIAGGAEEADAIYAADKVVRRSQGSGGAKDLAAIQRGTGRWGEAQKLFTMFYSYFSAVYQRQRTLGRDVAGAGSKDIPKLLARAWWLIVVPPLLSQIVSGRGPDDDEDWGTWSFKQMLFNSLGTLPFVKDLAQPAWDKFAGNKSFGYQLSPVQRIGESIVDVAGDAGSVAKGKETKHATKDVLDAAGYTTGLVPGQVSSATQFLVDVGSGTQDPQGVGEWYRGLTTGHAKKKP